MHLRAEAFFIINHQYIIMAIKLIANYSKRLGLPGYSSHQFEVSHRNGDRKHL